jgi:hypothetical protein
MTISCFSRCASIFLLILLAGCATKYYGRQGDLTDYERRTLTCREINLEMAKCDGFSAHVDRESEFDGRSVLSFLGDFGLGNVLEKSAAIDSANVRKGQLESLRSDRQCNVAAIDVQTTGVAALTSPAVPAFPRSPGTPAFVGEDRLQAEFFAKAQGCNAQPRAVFNAKGPGFETFTVECVDGEALSIRCEWGNCRALR